MSAPASSVYGCTGTVPPRITERSDLDPELRARIRTLQRLEPRRTVHRLVAFIVLGGTGAGITFGVPHWTARSRPRASAAKTSRGSPICC